MPEISLSKFLDAANRSKANQTIKLNGQSDVKTVGWTTWKSTNRKVMSAFIAAVKREYGEELFNLAFTPQAFPSGKPLKGRQVRDLVAQLNTLRTEKENRIQSNQATIGDFFSPGEGNTPSQARSYTEGLVKQLQDESELPDVDGNLTHLADTALKKAEKELSELGKTKILSSGDIKDILCKHVAQISNDIRNAYKSSRGMNGKAWAPEVMQCLSSFQLKAGSDYLIFGDVISEMMEAPGNKDLTNPSLDNSKKIYKEMCSRLGVEPEPALELEQSTDKVNDKIWKKLSELYKSNDNLATQMRSFSEDFEEGKIPDDSPWAPYRDACLEIPRKLAEKCPQLKDYLHDHGTGKLSDDTIKSLRRHLYFFINNDIKMQSRLVTPEILAEAIQRKYALEIFDEMVEKMVDNEVIQPNKLNDVPKKILRESRIKTMSSIPNEVRFAFSLQPLSTDKAEEMKQKILDHLKQTYPNCIADGLASANTCEYVKKEIQNACALTDEEASAIDLSKIDTSFTVLNSKLAETNKENKLPPPSYEDYMGNLKKKADKFIALKSGLLHNLASLKDRLTPDIYGRLRENAIISPNFPNAEMHLRLSEITSNINYDALMALDKNSSLQTITSAFTHTALQFEMNKTEQEKRYDPFCTRTFTMDMLLMVIGQKPELLEVLKKVPPEKFYEASRSLEKTKDDYANQTKGLHEMHSAGNLSEEDIKKIDASVQIYHTYSTAALIVGIVGQLVQDSQ